LALAAKSTPRSLSSSSISSASWSSVATTFLKELNPIASVNAVATLTRRLASSELFFTNIASMAVAVAEYTSIFLSFRWISGYRLG
jgi:hypothetical protein